jgi:CDP-2,3-bis-(O-geranylgeranyl)-sn-glycerol synthase
MISVLAFAKAAYLFAPLFVAALLSAVVLRFDLWRRLRIPIDGGRRWRGRRIFGDSKTWRGVVVAVVGCTVGVALQKYLIGPNRLAVVDYAQVSVVGFALAMGIGAMAGELPNSFVKRQRGIAPGKTTSGPLALVFYVWDQVDLLIGAWPLLALWIPVERDVVLASFTLALVVHPTVSLVGYLVGARRSAR